MGESVGLKTVNVELGEGADVDLAIGNRGDDGLDGVSCPENFKSFIRAAVRRRWARVCGRSYARDRQTKHWRERPTLEHLRTQAVRAAEALA